MANELIFKNNIKLDGVTQVVNNSVAALDDNVLLTKAAVANMMTAGAYSAGDGIDITNGVIAAKVSPNNGLSINAAGNISMAVAVATSAGGTGGTPGAVKIFEGNGLAYSSGTVSMTTAGANPGAVKVTTGYGLAYDSSTGAISYKLSTGNGLTIDSNGYVTMDLAKTAGGGTAGAVKVTVGNGLAYANGAISISAASTGGAGTVTLASTIESDGTGVPTSGTVFSALSNYVPTSKVVTAGGVSNKNKIVELDNNGLIPASAIPDLAITNVFTATSLDNTAASGTPGQAGYNPGGILVQSGAKIGDVCIVTTGNPSTTSAYILSSDATNAYQILSNWKKLSIADGYATASHTHSSSDITTFAGTGATDGATTKGIAGFSSAQFSATQNGFITLADLSGTYVIPTVIAPAYNASTSYSNGDLCSYNGKLYRYKYTISASNKVPTNTTYWENIPTSSAYAATSHTHSSGDIIGLPIRLQLHITGDGSSNVFTYSGLPYSSLLYQVEVIASNGADKGKTVYCNVTRDITGGDKKLVISFASPPDEGDTFIVLVSSFEGVSSGSSMTGNNPAT